MNVLLPEPGSSSRLERQWRSRCRRFLSRPIRLGRRHGHNDIAAGLVADTYGGFRDDSGYEQQKGFFRLNRSLQSGEFERRIQRLEPGSGNRWIHYR